MKVPNDKLFSLHLREQANQHMRNAIDSHPPERINYIAVSLSKLDVSSFDRSDLALVSIVFNTAMGNFLMDREENQTT